MKWKMGQPSQKLTREAYQEDLKPRIDEFEQDMKGASISVNQNLLRVAKV
jgi:hypothetical protein